MDADVLCPMEGRRSVDEIDSKLALANVLAVLTAYAPMLHMRGEEVFSFKVFWFLVHPCILFLQYGIALCIVAICGSVGLFITDKEDTRRFLMRAIGLLFGNINEHHDEHANDLPSPSARRGKWLDKVMKAIGYFLLSVQSSSTIYTFSRRAAHDAVSQSDVRLLHLACGALGASFLSIVYIIWEPRAPQPDPDADTHRGYIVAETFLVYIRDLDYTRIWPHERGTWEDTRRVLERGISFRERRRRMSEISYYNAFGGATLAGAIILPKKTSEWHLNEICLLSFMLGGAILHVVFFSYSNIREKSYTSTIERALITERASNTKVASTTYCVWICLFCVFSVLVDFMMGFAVGFHVITGWYAWFKSQQRLMDLHDEMRMLKNWPEDEACPLLWQDPTAGVLWGLV